MNRFNRPRLITFDDPAYRLHVEQMKLQRANQRATQPPSQRDLFGGEVEEVLRGALSSRMALSDRRIVEYEERKGRAWQRKYRELDAVIVDQQARVHVFEIKASRRAGALHRAIRQLRDTTAILKLAFRTVSATILFVDTGTLTAAEQAELAAADPPLERLPQTLADAIAEHAEAQQVQSLDALTPFPAAIELVVLSLDTVIALAGNRPLSLDWDADEREAEVDDLPRPASTPYYSTPDDAADESPFAAALRNIRTNAPNAQEDS